MNWKEFFAYGEKVPGYEVRVPNEREARAAAAIFVRGCLSGACQRSDARYCCLFRVFCHIFRDRFYDADYPAALRAKPDAGAFFVQNQKPEYVGAVQKRFAWSLGFMLAWPMFYYLVIDFQPNPLKVLVCLICMALLFFEAAFSICLGCKIFEWVKRKDPKYRPGGVCEMNIKEPIQTFNPAQKAILIVTILVMGYGVFAYFTKLPDRTVFVKKMKTLMMGPAELDAMQKAKEKVAEDAFFSDDEEDE